MSAVGSEYDDASVDMTLPSQVGTSVINEDNLTEEQLNFMAETTEDIKEEEGSPPPSEFAVVPQARAEQVPPPGEQSSGPRQGMQVQVHQLRRGKTLRSRRRTSCTRRTPSGTGWRRTIA